MDWGSFPWTLGGQGPLRAWMRQTQDLVKRQISRPTRHPWPDRDGPGEALRCRHVSPCPLIRASRTTLPSTAIGLRKYRIPSDLRSQAGYRLVSTTVGDHVGILGAVVFVFVFVSGDGWTGGVW